MNEKTAAFILIKQPHIIVLPPLLADDATDFFILTNQSDLNSDFWDVKYIKNLNELEDSILNNPQDYLGDYNNYIQIKPDQIITGKLSEDMNCIVTVPPVSSLVPATIPLQEPTLTEPRLNPSYTNGLYEGYPLQLSICLPISNRADSLEKCLLGLKPLLDQLDTELLVVDTSTDGSRQIAESYGAKIIPFTWTGDFSMARNTAIQHASGAWIFSIDDDEWLEDVQEIIDFFRSDEWKKYNIALYKVRNYTTPEGTTFEDVSVQRMAKNHPKLHYIHAIHECFDLASFSQHIRIKYFSTFAHHYGYAYTNDAERESKTYRNIAGCYTALKAAPSDLRLYYQLANELTIAKNYSASAAYCLKILALSRLNSSLNSFGMKWEENALMFLFLISHLSNDRKLIDSLKKLTDGKRLDCFKSATIDYILAVHSFNISEYESVCFHADRFYSSREEFLQRKDRLALSSGITVNLVEPQTRTNAIYIIHTFSLLAQELEDDAALIFDKVDFNLTSEIDLPILAKILCDFSIENFMKLSKPISDDLLAEMYKYCIKQSTHENIDASAIFNILFEKIFNSIVDQDNVYLRLIKMHISPNDYRVFEQFCGDEEILRTYLEDILLCAAKNGFNSLKLLPALAFEDLQQALKALASQGKIEFLQIINQFLISIKHTSLYTVKETFFLCGILEMALFNEELCAWEKESQDYKEFFLIYINLMNKWSSTNYNQDMFSEENFDLLPATCRGAYYIEEGFNEKESKNLEKYIDFLKAAVRTCSVFNSGVKLLLSELKDTYEIDSLAEKQSKTEFELLGEQLKSTAKQMIDSGSFIESEKILLQLSKLLPDDEEISDLLSLCKG